MRLGAAALALGAGTLLCAGGSCAEEAPRDAWALHDGLLRAGRVEVAFHAPQAEARDARARVERAVRELDQGGLFAARLVEPGDEGDRGAARVLLADPRTPAATPLLEALGVEVSDEGFLYERRAYQRPDDALVATFADPERPGLPVTLYFGNDLARLGLLLDDATPAWRPLARCFRAGELDFEVDLALDGAPWRPSARDPGAARRALLAGHERHEEPSLTWILPAGEVPDDLGDYRESVRRAQAAVTEILGGVGTGPVPPPVRVRVHRDVEGLVIATGGWKRARVNPVHFLVDALVAPGRTHDGGAGAARAAALTLAGPPAERWLLDGIGVHAADRFWGRRLEDWVARLRAGGLVPPVREIVDPNAELSPLVLAPARGALVRYLCFSRGWDLLAGLWSGELSLRANERVRAGFETWLDGLVAERAEELAARPAPAVPSGWRGAHLWTRPGGGREAPGYGTPAAREALAELAAMGANAVALTVLDYADPGLPERAGGSRERELFVSTPEEALWTAVEDAHALGLGVLLSPHSVAQRSGGFRGWSAINTRAEWEAFFEGARRYAVHWALFAELCGAQVLSLGSDVRFATFTRRREDNREVWDLLSWKLEGWRAVLADARAAYSGALTYTANWVNQPAEIEFWSELDLVAGSLFDPLEDPLAPGLEPDDEAQVGMLRTNLAELIEVGRTHGLPVLVAEVGFPATSEAWRAPAEARGAEDEAAQARLLRRWARALSAVRGAGKDVAGFLVWCWDVPGSAQGSRARLFSPRGRAGEAALAELLAAPSGGG